MGNGLPVIALTIGDPAGVGPEITAKAFAAFNKSKDSFIPVLLGDEKFWFDTCESFKIHSGPVNVVPKPQRAKFEPGALNIYPLKLGSLKDVQAGKPSPKTGRIAMASIEKATELALVREVDAIVTNPISKKTINDAGFHFPGHTDYFADKTNTSKYAMCFVADPFRIAIVTGHLGIRKVHSKVKLARILRTITLLDEFLRALDETTPRIAVTGLNPHAGESGLLGPEEFVEVMPAVEAARSQGYDVTGPISAEAAFIGVLNKKFDGVVAMYHDQGIVPVKTFAPYRAVNVTLGLPFIRTSVGHGAAFDIAGKGIAKADSLKLACATAARLARSAWK